MQRTILIISLFLCSQQIFAQLQKGMIAVGLTSSIKTNKTDNEKNYTSTTVDHYYSKDLKKTSSFEITPTVSYFLSNRFAIGLQIGYTGSVIKEDKTDQYRTLNRTDVSNTKTVSSGITTAPYVKYYIPFSDHVYFFLKGSIETSFSVGKTTGTSQTTTIDNLGNSTLYQNDIDMAKIKTFQMYAGISPGLLFMPTQKIGLEFTLGNLISANKTIDESPNKTTSTTLEYLNFNTLRVGTGIYYFFK